MKKEEALKIVSRLAAGFPELEITQDTIALWEGYLIPLAADSMGKAVSDYLLLPGKKRFPTPGEVIGLYDRHEIENREKKRQEEREDDVYAYKKLFREPLGTFPNDFRKKAVALIRDVTEGRIKYMSEDWLKQYGSIFPGYDPATGLEI